MVFTVICPFCRSHVRVPENSRTNIFRHGIFYSTTLQSDANLEGIAGREIYATISEDNKSYAFFDSDNNVLNDAHRNNLLANHSQLDIGLINLEGCGKKFCIKIDDNGNKVAAVPEQSINVKRVRVQKIIPNGYYEGKTMIFEYNDREVSVIIPKNGAPGDLLILDIILKDNDLSLLDVKVSRRSIRSNLRRGNTSGGGYSSFSSDGTVGGGHTGWSNSGGN